MAAWEGDLVADEAAPEAASASLGGDPLATDREELRTLHPGVALRPGHVDPIALLVVWYLRRSFVPLLVLGFAIATLFGRLDDPGMNLANPASILRALLTPWVGVAAAVVVRVLANVGALLLAFPLTRWSQPADYHVGSSSGRVRSWTDRWHRTAAYRALRWTWPVRRLAAERLGRSARWLLLMDRAWVVGGVVAVLAWLVIASSVADPAAAAAPGGVPG